MKDVPEPPTQFGSRGGRYLGLYLGIRELPPSQSHAVEVKVEGGKKELAYMKSQLGTLAKKDGVRILSSRNAESSLAWFWWAKLSDKV